MDTLLTSQVQGPSREIPWQASNPQTITFDNKPVTSQKIKDDRVGWFISYLFVLEVELKDTLCGIISIYEQGGLRGSVDARLER
jgi:hypothetical protein